MKLHEIRQWLVLVVIVAVAVAIIKFLAFPGTQEPPCKIIYASYTVEHGEYLSDIALREIKDQKVKWSQSISFNQLIADAVKSIQFASGLNSSTPSEGTVLQIPDLNDPDC